MKNIITNERLDYLNNLKIALQNLKTFIDIKQDAYIYDEFIYQLTFNDVLDDDGNKIIKDILLNIFDGPNFTIKSLANMIRSESGIMISNIEFFAELANNVFTDDIGFTEILFRGNISARKFRSCFISTEFLDSEHAESYTYPEEIFNKVNDLYRKCSEYTFDAVKYFGEETYPNPDGTDSRVSRIREGMTKALGCASGTLLNYIFNIDDPKCILEYLRSNIFVKLQDSKKYITRDVYYKGYANLSKLLRETSDKNDIIDIIKYLPSEKAIVANIFFNTSSVTKDPDVVKILRNVEYKSEIAETFHILIKDRAISDEQCISAAYLMLDVFYDMRKRGSGFSKHKFLKNFIEMSIGGYNDRIDTGDMSVYIKRVAAPILSENLALFDEIIINKLFSKRSSWRYSPVGFILRVVLEIAYNSDDIDLVKNILTRFVFNRCLLLELDAAKGVIREHDTSIDSTVYAVAKLFATFITKFPEHSDYFILNAIHHAYVSSLLERNTRKMLSFLEGFSTCLDISKTELLEKYRSMGSLYKKYMTADELTSFNMLIIYEIGLLLKTFSREKNCPFILSNIVKNKPGFDEALYDRTMSIIYKNLFAPGCDSEILGYIPVEVFDCFNLRGVNNVSEIMTYKDDCYYRHCEKVTESFNAIYRPVFNIHDSDSMSIGIIFYGLFSLKSLIPNDAANRIVENIFSNYTLENYDTFKSKIPTYIFEARSDGQPVTATEFLTFRHYTYDLLFLFKNAYAKNIEEVLRGRVASDIIDFVFSALKTILTPYSISPEVFTNIDDARDTTQFLLM